MDMRIWLFALDLALALIGLRRHAEHLRTAFAPRLLPAGQWRRLWTPAQAADARRSGESR